MKRAEHQPETIDVSIYAGIYCKLWTVPDRGHTGATACARAPTSHGADEGRSRGVARR